ncbi:MAG TPA: OmpA family protein [Candidatus Acidoferrales bacterium]|nr:OmpA family protein [Candidatus Acidoferrales bacterium]
MNHRKLNWLVLLAMLAAVLMAAGCHKKAPAPPPPPPPPPAAPTAQLNADKAVITEGDSVTLTWQTSNATDVSIEGVGMVEPNGSKVVSPTTSTNYRLVAKGAGGSVDSTVRITVNPKPTPPPPPPPPGPTEEELFARNIQDVFFAYDSYALDDKAQQTIAANAAFLKQHPSVSFQISGHCDERGSEDYNLALGTNRANSVKQALVSAGVTNPISTISYGKMKPFCSESNEACWQQNRRGHFVYQK